LGEEEEKEKKGSLKVPVLSFRCDWVGKYLESKYVDTSRDYS